MENEEKILMMLEKMQSDIDLIKKHIGVNVFNRFDKNLKIHAFDFLNNANPKIIAKFIQDESTETVAIILFCLDSYFAARILDNLSKDTSAEVIKKISELDEIPAEVIRDIERKLFDKLSVLLNTQDFVTVGDGFSSVIEMIKSSDSYTKVAIIESLFERDSKLAEEIKRRLFAFEDILNFDDRATQLILRDVDSRDLLFAMYGVSQEVADKIYKNISRRNAELLRKDLETMKNVDMREVEKSRFRFENVIRALEEKGDIVVYRG